MKTWEQIEARLREIARERIGKFGAELDALDCEATALLWVLEEKGES